MSLQAAPNAKAMKTNKVASALANMALLLASCLAGLLLCEAGLRLFHPKYAHLAEAPFIRHPNLLRTPTPNNRWFMVHPDTGSPHPYFHNNLGLRQHRDFNAAALQSSVNIGFFGDSFTENIRMKAQHSFTEPLDYLLNIDRGEGGGVNVLNFSVSGYGASQSLLRYEMLDFPEALDHVFYVFCQNDLSEDLDAGLLRLDYAGQLVRREAALSGLFTLLSKLHLSYLVLDAGGQLSAHLKEIEAKARRLVLESDQLKQGYKPQGLPRSAYPLFRQTLRRWKEAVEKNGSSFHLVYLPRENLDAPGVAAIVREEGVETVNLRDCFGERDPTHLRTPWRLSPYRFKRDYHWNEAGNRLAAICLHRFLQGALQLPPLSEEEVEQALSRYYSAFEAPASEDRPASPHAAAIRGKYAALEPVRWVLYPDEMVARAPFDVHLHDGWLVYVKEGCKPADFDLRFFLHVFPANVLDLHPYRQELGFDSLDFWHSIDEPTCSFRRKLPDYAIKRIRTGQFLTDRKRGYANLWKWEHVLSDHDMASPRLSKTP